MEILVGLSLIALTVYTSTLSYALRCYSRGRFADYLPEDARRFWLQRLDDYESELAATLSFVRLATIVATIAWVELQMLPLDDAGWSAMSLPALASLGILLIAAVGVPHALALYAGEVTLARSRWIVWGLRLALYPVERLLALTEFIVRRLLGKGEPADEDEAERVEREIMDAVSEGELHGAVDEEQKEIIESVFEWHDTHVSEIMTPRTEIVAIPADADYDRARRTIIEAGHSRLPVYEGSLDRIVSVLYAKDLLTLEDPQDFDARTLGRPVPFVPESKTIDQLLRQMRQERVHIAIVLDEYGGTAGLVTIEDILEELVGEIDDEYDRSTTPEMRRIDEDTLEVDARMHVDEVNEALKIDIPDNGDYDTIGGFVFATLGKIPQRGEQFKHDNVEFTVIDAEPRKINRLRIHVERRRESA